VPRTRDLLLGIGDHFLPLGQPSGLWNSSAVCPKSRRVKILEASENTASAMVSPFDGDCQDSGLVRGGAFGILKCHPGAHGLPSLPVSPVVR
jgi:hypothetical protein